MYYSNINTHKLFVNTNCLNVFHNTTLLVMKASLPENLKLNEFIKIKLVLLYFS